MNKQTIEYTKWYLAERNKEALLCDGLDKALIGVAERINLTVAAYDVNKIIQILKTQMELDSEQLKLSSEEQDSIREDMATEHFEFNIAGSWVGEGTPVFVYHIYDEE